MVLTVPKDLLTLFYKLEYPVGANPAVCAWNPFKTLFSAHRNLLFLRIKKSSDVVLLTKLVYKAIDRCRHHINLFPVFCAGIYIYAPQEITQVSAPVFN